MTAGADGTLTVNSSKLDDALTRSFESVANLFRANASFDAPGLEWLDAPGAVDLSDRSIEVIVSQAAERATLAGSTLDLGAGLVIDDTNDTFQISLDGIRSENVSLTHGTYTDGDVSHHGPEQWNRRAVTGARHDAEQEHRGKHLQQLP